jgi:hypothetical protein
VAFQRAVNGFRNSELWPVDRCVFTDDDFAPSMATDQPQTIQREGPPSEGSENFSLSSVLAAKPATAKQTPGYNGYTPRETTGPLPPYSAERPRPKSRRKDTASGVVLIRTAHKESLNNPNIAGFSAAKPKRRTLCA